MSISSATPHPSNNNYLNTVKKPTPTLKPKPEDELKRKIESRDLIVQLFDCGKKIGFTVATVATASVYFHRFFSRHSFKSYDIHTMLMTCLFLSGKVEEKPKPLNTVICICMQTIKKDPNFQLSDAMLSVFRNNVVEYEFKLLQTIGFEFSIDHPHKYVLRYSGSTPEFASKAFQQTAWNFANDSLQSTVCLRFKSSTIAAAVLQLAAKFHKLEFPEGKHPGEFFHASPEELKCIGNQILDVLELRSPTASDPTKSTTTTTTTPTVTTTDNPNEKKREMEADSDESQPEKKQKILIQPNLGEAIVQPSDVPA